MARSAILSREIEFVCRIALCRLSCDRVKDSDQKFLPDLNVRMTAGHYRGAGRVVSGTYTEKTEDCPWVAGHVTPSTHIVRTKARPDVHFDSPSQSISLHFRNHALAHSEECIHLVVRGLCRTGLGLCPSTSLHS